MSVEWSFARSIAGGYDEELVDLSIHIDRGYVSQSEMVIWRDIVRNVFYDSTRRRPIPFSDQWAPDHPVLAAFVEKSLGDTTFQLHQSQGTHRLLRQCLPASGSNRRRSCGDRSAR